MGDSDDDYRDVGLENNALLTGDTNDSQPKKSNVNSLGKKVRGKDIDWIEVARFTTILEYKESQIYKEIKEKLLYEEKVSRVC